jgi:hypothetical protein
MFTDFSEERNSTKVLKKYEGLYGKAKIVVLDMILLFN